MEERDITLRELIGELSKHVELLDREISSIGWYSIGGEGGHVVYFGIYGDRNSEYTEIRIPRRVLE